VVTVINRVSLSVPPEQIADQVQREFPPAFRALDGFQRFLLVRSGEREATVIIVWDTAEHAAAGAAAIGPTLFNRIVTPVSTGQDRVVGEVLASAEA
jgi:hypothetical protein